MSKPSRAVPYFSAYSSKGKQSTAPVAATAQLAVYNIRARNNSSTAGAVGIVRKMGPDSIKVWSYIGTTYTNITAAVQAGTASSLFGSNNNDAFFIQSRRPIGLVGFTISTARSNGVFTYNYYNGSSFAALTTFENPTDYSSAGDNFIVARPPIDMVTGGDTNLTSGMYNLKVICTTKPTGGAVAINNFWVGEILDLQDGCAQYNGSQLIFPTDDPFLLSGSESIIPYFETADAANDIGLFYATV